MSTMINRRQLLQYTIAATSVMAGLIPTQTAQAKAMLTSGGKLFLFPDEMPTANLPVKQYQQAGIQPFWLTYVDEQTIMAFTGQCTQDNCLVRWHGKVRGFVCPFCGSQYGIDGRLQHGAAPRGLSYFAIHREYGPKIRETRSTPQGTSFMKEEAISHYMINIWSISLGEAR